MVSYPREATVKTSGFISPCVHLASRKVLLLTVHLMPFESFGWLNVLVS